MTSRDAVAHAPREWTRVHPISPLLGGWAVVAGLGTFWIDQRFKVGPAGSGPDFLSRVPVIVAIAVTIAVLVIAGGYVQWWFHAFRISDEAIEQRKGLLFKQNKQARLDRVQAVDVVQPLVARLIGLAALSIEVAGGTGSGIKLQYLRLADAEALRNELLALAGGGRAAARAAASSGVEQEGEDGQPGGSRRLAPAPGSARTRIAAAVERGLIAVPISRTVGSVALSGSTIVLAIVVLGVAVSSIVASLMSKELDILGVIFGGGAIGIAVGLFGWFSSMLSALNHSLNFRVGLASDGVRLAHGLLETTRQTIPPGRVQAVRLTQTLLWRSKDWWRVVINVAGYHDEQAKVSVLLPVGTRQEALLALWTVLPDLGHPDPVGLVGTALSGLGTDEGFTAVPRRARLADPFQWRRLGVRATETALLIRSGRFMRTLVVVPHERTQSLAVTQGPLQRRLRLASVQIHSTAGPVKPVAAHLDVQDALALIEAQAARARDSRRRQTPEQWMTAVGLEPAAEPVAASLATPGVPEPPA